MMIICCNDLAAVPLIFQNFFPCIGVPNFVLSSEDPEMAVCYRKKQDIAEQNSVDVAWNLLMEPFFPELRRAIYSNAAELNRFRQLIVNSLMATGIFDKELADLRKKRWEATFHQQQDNKTDA
jgi:hypothetical protein